MSEDDQGIEKTKRRGCHNEHVDRRNVGQVVVQQATPGRGGDFGPPRQGSADRGLADLDAEFEQFAVDAGGILSQKHEGWTVLPTLYDDGGFSNETPRRSKTSTSLAKSENARKRLIADIEAGQIDVVVVYKVDRLTIGAKVVSHGRYVAFQMAEVAIPKNLFADILRLIAELRPPPDAALA